MNTILNTSIITGLPAVGEPPATYRIKARTLQDVKVTMMTNPWQSAIGHTATAEILTDLTGYIVPVNRIEYRQEIGDTAIVFKLRGRAPEGVILTREQIEEIGYDFYLMTRLT